MKRPFAPVGVFCFCALSSSAGFAQSAVTLYGVIDEYVGINHADGPGTIVGVNGGGDKASRFGFKGSEDLGGGYKANFDLEDGYFAETGSAADATRAFNRQAWVGISGNFGEARVGRQQTPQFYMLGKLDVFDGATYGSGLNNMSGYTPRYDNVISYATPNYRGFAAGAGVALGNQPGSVVAGNIYMFSTEYANGPLYAGINYVANKELTGIGTVRGTFVGGNYDFGSSKVALGYYRGNNYGTTTTQRGLYYSIYSVSGFYRVTVFDRLGAGVMYADGSSGAKPWAIEGSLIYQHDVSKRTMLYAVASHIGNHNGAAFFLHGSAPIPQNVPEPGGDAFGAQVGIVHTF